MTASPKSKTFEVCKASAGSGKTYRLAIKFISILLQHYFNGDEKGYRNILAVTFTNDATNEMKIRIVKNLYDLKAGGDQNFLDSVLEELKEKVAEQKRTDKSVKQAATVLLSNILHDYSRMFIVTIDSFFQRVLRNLAHELGIGTKFNISLDTDVMIEDAVQKLYVEANENKNLIEYLRNYVLEKLESGSSINIQSALVDFAKQLYNETYQKLEPKFQEQIKNSGKNYSEFLIEKKKATDKIIAEFEKKLTDYAVAIKKLLDDNGIEAKDIKGVSNSGPKQFCKKILEEKKYDGITESVGTQMAEDGKTMTHKQCKDVNKKDVIANSVAPLCNNAIDYYQEQLEKYISAKLLSENINQLTLLQKVSETIKSIKEESNLFMLSDTSILLNRLLTEGDAMFVYEKIGATVQHVMIDEFQDTSKLQWENFEKLLEDIAASGNDNLMVGDVKQSIYRWRNGDWKILNDIENNEKLKDVIWTKPLKKNFRTKENIVKFNNELFRKASELLDVDAITKAYTDVAQEIGKKEKQKGGYVSVTLNIEKEKVFNRIVEILKTLKDRGVKANDICFLISKNNEILELASQLSEAKIIGYENLEISEDDYKALVEGNYFDAISENAYKYMSSDLIQCIVSAMKLVDNQDDAVAKFVLEKVLQNQKLPLRVTAFINVCSEYGKYPLYKLVQKIYNYFDLKKMSGQEAFYYAFMDGLLAFTKQNSSNLKLFLNYWDEILSEKSVSSNQGDGVRIMTIHKSKGLEFHTVIVPYCDWDMKTSPTNQPTLWCGKKSDESPFDMELLPIKATNKAEKSLFEEEYTEEILMQKMDNLNKLYVALTRPKNNLFIINRKKEKSDKIILSFFQEIITFTDIKLNENIPESDSECADYIEYTVGDIVSYSVESKDKEKSPFDEPTEMCTIQPIEFREESENFMQSVECMSFFKSSSVAQAQQEGNLFHALFSRITDIESIEPAVAKFVSEGILKETERESYIKKMKDVIQNSKVDDWFSGKYQLFNECSIITKEETKRPDRVMIYGDEATVVDYKTGEENGNYITQVKNYKNLLTKMGYKNVKGFIWYLSTNKVVEV